MVIEQEEKVFIHIPKTGGTSINSRYIKKYRMNSVLKHSRHPFIIYQNRGDRVISEWHFTYDQAYTQFPDYKYYTVIRHPVSRWVSIYKHFLMRDFIVGMSLYEWTEKVMDSLPRFDFFNGHKFEYEQSFMDFHKFFMPQWMYYREPEVEVHRMEDQTIWKALGLRPQHIKKGIDIPNFDGQVIFDMIYDYYKKDFERWQMTE